MSELRYAVRILLKNRTFSLLSVLTLALGIGANTAIFCIVNTVLLKPYSYKDPEKIVSVWETVKKDSRMKWRVSPGTYRDWTQQSRSFDALAAFGAATLNLTGAGEPEQLNGVHVTSEYFSVLGIEPVSGRSFLAEENEPGRGNVVILSHELWNRRFGGENMIGRSIQLDGLSYTVVGIMPAGIYPAWPQTSGGIQFQESYRQFWIPTAMTAERKSNRTSHVLGVIGKLKRDITLAQAQSELDALAKNLAERHPENVDEGIRLNQFTDEITGNVRPALYILLATVGFVLLIVCANVGGLLLSRLASRSREIAIRSALGAEKRDLFRQFSTEGLLLVAAGTALGIWLAPFSINALIHLIPQDIPRLDQIGIDGRVIAFTAGVSAFVWFLLTIIMMIHAMRPDLNAALSLSGRHATEAKHGRRFQQALVIGQLSIAVVLLLGAGLLIRSFQQLLQVEPGFKPQRMLVVDIVLPQSRYSEWQKINQFYSNLLNQIRSHPEVQYAAIAYDHPLESNWINSFEIEGEIGSNLEPSGRFIPVSADYFATAGIALIQGREFTKHDDPNLPGVVIVNETLVRKYFGNTQPLGHKLRISPPSMIWGDAMPQSFEIVGVAHDVRFMGLDAELEPAFYVPASQSPLVDMKVLIRTKQEPLQFAPIVRSIVKQLDADQPVASMNSMSRMLDASLASRKFNMIVMGLFGLIAIVLASIGIYGLFSFNVTLRTQEISVRLALGASPSDILKMILKAGLTMSIAGSVIGLVSGALLTRYMSAQLYGIRPVDPLSYIGVFLVLMLVALLACFIPARRAMRVDPISALRSE